MVITVRVPIYLVPPNPLQDISLDDIKAAVQAMREKSGPGSATSGGAGRVTSRSAEGLYDALEKYGIDFTKSAYEGKLDPVIGRDEEIRRAIQILSRRTKNNPVLIGDPGVGELLENDVVPCFHLVFVG